MHYLRICLFTGNAQSGLYAIPTVSGINLKTIKLIHPPPLLSNARVPLDFRYVGLRKERPFEKIMFPTLTRLVPFGREHIPSLSVLCIN